MLERPPEITALRAAAWTVLEQAVRAVLPEPAVKRHLDGLALPGRVHVLAIGKAAWRMAQAAREALGARLARGMVLTKYGHSRGPLPGFEVFEAGHPLPDANGLSATRRILAWSERLSADDTLLLLLSGGGSALFELPAPGLGLDDVLGVTAHLLRSGADIVEINSVRKRLSLVKGGRFAQRVAPARVLALILSDVPGERLDSVASGPAWPDATTCAQALAVAEKYRLPLNAPLRRALGRETPKHLDNVQARIVGSVDLACAAAADSARALGYAPLLLTTSLDCEAREAGRMLAALARQVCADGQPAAPPCALILGGESVVTVRGGGRGGRNQEVALAAAPGIQGLDNVVVASLGSDGDDGPTDAAGGMVDGQTAARLAARGLSAARALADNDAYPALEAVGDLLKTGPTGTNVNDLALVLVGEKY